MALELLSALCTFENSNKCSKISFESDASQNSEKVYSIFKKRLPCANSSFYRTECHYLVKIQRPFSASGP